MKIIVMSILVEDQAKALEFYTETLGFIKKTDVPAGEFRWLTFVSRDDHDGTELYSNRINILPPKSIRKDYMTKESQQQCLALQMFTKSTID